ncbi:MAG: formate dehydrogenase accessory sulfurtransferase FdhD [Psychrobacter sp.]|nr:formate dehydrogenase accessory sulfurtransferase FdhD [Psychrobacter sp.]
MMIAEMNDETRNRTGEQCLTDRMQDVAEVRTTPSATPMTRTHLSQKHAYPSDNNTSTAHRHVAWQPANLAVEAAVAIVINGIHYAVLMASPHQLEYLAIGFLFSEGLIQQSHELLDWDVTQLSDIASYQQFTPESVAKSDESGNAASKSFEQTFLHLQDYDTYVVELILNQRCHQRIQAQRRQLAGRTGCGMCGITGLSQALPDLSGYLPSPLHRTSDNPLHSNLSNEQKDEHQKTSQKKSAMPSLDYLLELRRQVDASQHTHQLTGAVHAAATMYQQQLYLFEDVGRHNALDKLIGWQLRQKIETECVLMTSRLSIELVQKSIRGGIPWLVGMSAPTSTAVRVAGRYGLGLAGFLRDNRVTYYSGI